jgi:hypothetical protein
MVLLFSAAASSAVGSSGEQKAHPLSEVCVQCIRIASDGLHSAVSGHVVWHAESGAAAEV